MAQYEQKTDSREFEVANPDQHPGAWGGDSPADADRHRYSAVGRGSPRPTRAADLENRQRFGLHDRGSGEREPRPRLPRNRRQSWPRTLTVPGKRWLPRNGFRPSILEFLACRAGERTGGALLIYQPRATDPAGPSAELVQLELGRAKPGQILLADNVFRRLRDLPGIEFVNAPGGMSGYEPTGSTQLVWTTPDRVSLMTESVGDAVEPMGADSAPVGATLIVNSPIPGPAIGDPRFASREPTTNTAPPTARTQAYTSSETAAHRAANQKASNSLTEELDLAERSLFTRNRVIFGSVAVVLVAVAIVVLFQPTRVAKPQIPPTPQAQEQTPSTATGTTDQKTPAADAPPAAPRAQTAPSQPEPAKSAAKPPATAARKPPAESLLKNKKEIPPASEEVRDTPEPPAVDESGNWLPSDIPRLLTMAGSDMGDGKYDKARREYRIVLRLQPKNQPALDGITKLNKIQSDQQ